MTNTPKDAAEIASRLHRLTGLNQNQIDSLSLSLDPFQVDQINDADLASLVNGTLPGLPLNASGGLPLGLPGATQPARFVGGTASGAPTTGTFAVRDWVVTGTGAFYVCTVAGTPGTWVQVSGGGGGVPALAPTAVKTANYTAAVSDLVKFDLTSGSKTLTLPTAPVDGARIAAKIVVQPGTNTLTINCGGSDVLNKAGGSTSATLSLLNQSVTLQYQTSGAIWNVVSSDLPLSQLDLRFAPLLRAVSVAYAATVTPNADTTDILNIGALTGNLTLANPTGTPRDGQMLRLRMQQDSTGGRTITFGNAYAFGTDVTAALIPTTASAKYVLLFSWDATSSTWRALAIARGF